MVFDIVDFQKKELRNYLSTVGHKIQMLIRRLETLKTESYPTPHPITFAEILIRILARAFGEIERLNNQIGKMAEVDIADRAWLIHFFTIRYLSHWIEAIQKANVSTMTGGIIDAFDTICNQAQLGTSLVIYPTWNYNFTAEEVSDQLASIADRISMEKQPSIFEGKYSHYLIITYPYIVEESVLELILLAHEVGHFIDHTKEWSTKIEEKLKMKGKVIFPKEIPKKEHNIANGLVEYITSHWIKEIVADTIAVSILGPAYVVGLSEFLFSNPHLRSASKEIDTSHPPVELRLHLMAQYSKELQIEPAKSLPEHVIMDEIAKNVLKYVEVVINSFADQKPLIIDKIQEFNISKETAQWIYSRLLKIMIIVVDDIRLNGHEILPQNWVFSPNDVLHASALNVCLVHGFTPTKLPQPFDKSTPTFAAVMNSGWFYLLNQSLEEKFSLFKLNPNSDHRPEMINESLISIHQLVAKAIEALNFQRVFVRQQGNAGVEHVRSIN